MRQPDWDWPIWIPRARPFDWAWDLEPWDFADPAIYRKVRAIEDGIEAAARQLARMRDGAGQ
jgi:hypothetical protein